MLEIRFSLVRSQNGAGQPPTGTAIARLVPTIDMPGNRPLECGLAYGATQCLGLGGRWSAKLVFGATGNVYWLTAIRLDRPRKLEKTIVQISPGCLGSRHPSNVTLTANLEWPATWFCKILVAGDILGWPEWPLERAIQDPEQRLGVLSQPCPSFILVAVWSHWFHGRNGWALVLAGSMVGDFCELAYNKPDKHTDPGNLSLTTMLVLIRGMAGSRPLV